MPLRVAYREAVRLVAQGLFKTPSKSAVKAIKGKREQDPGTAFKRRAGIRLPSAQGNTGILLPRGQERRSGCSISWDKH